MTSLEQRLSEASGPDRELDAYLWGEMEGWTVHEVGNHILVADKAERVQRVIGYADPGKTARNVTITVPDIPPYTSSIDAALALVERKFGPLDANWAYSLTNDYASYNRCHLNILPQEGWPTGAETVNAEAETMPLAICLALVRALAHKERA